MREREEISTQHMWNENENGSSMPYWSYNYSYNHTLWKKDNKDKGKKITKKTENIQLNVKL